MFERAYSAAMRHYRLGQPWYHDSDIRTGQPTQLAFASLQAFWPGCPSSPSNALSCIVTCWAPCSCSLLSRCAHPCCLGLGAWHMCKIVLCAARLDPAAPCCCAMSSPV